MREIDLTYDPDGWSGMKESIPFTAGEALRFACTPSSEYDATGKSFRLVISPSTQDAPRVNSIAFTFTDEDEGEFEFETSEEATLEFPEETYNGELWNSTDGILIKRWVSPVTANPRASGDAPAYPDPPIDWSDIGNVPAGVAAIEGLTPAAVYSGLVGDGVSTSYVIAQATHGLAANGKLAVFVYDASTGVQELPSITINNSTGAVTLAFSSAPSSSAKRVVIIGAAT